MAASEAGTPADLPENPTVTLVRPSALLGQRYRLERELGQGGFGTVYLARDERLHDKPVVVKILKGDRFQDWLQKRFADEVKALARIDHPGIVGILDVGQTPDGSPFLVMHYVEGITLRALLKQERIQPERIVGLVRQIGHALDAAHARGVIHRDLKPENIMVQRTTAGEFVRIIDFGIASVWDDRFEPGGETSRILGTLAYMAPEQASGKACVQSDVFALGIIAWEMLAGENPARETPLGVPLSDSSRLPAGIPDDAIGAIRRAVALEPADRFAHAGDFAIEFAAPFAQPAQGGSEPAKPDSAVPAVQQRALDVAAARQIPIHKPAEVLALIRRSGSGGLVAILETDRDYTARPEDVRSKTFQLEFPSDPVGRMLPLDLGLRLECPDFEPASVFKLIRVPPGGDSEVCTFLITPRFPGELRINLEVVRGDVLIAARTLITEAVPSDREIFDRSTVLVSIPLAVLVRADVLSSSRVTQSDYTRSISTQAIAARKLPLVRSAPPSAEPLDQIVEEGRFGAEPRSADAASLPGRLNLQTGEFLKPQSAVLKAAPVPQAPPRKLTANLLWLLIMTSSVAVVIVALLIIWLVRR